MAVGAGATSVSGIRFDIKDRASAEQTALQRAVADARAQADTAAQAAGMRGRARRADRGPARAAMPPPRPMMAMRAEMAVSAEPPIAPGELEVKVDASVTARHVRDYADSLGRFDDDPIDRLVVEQADELRARRASAPCGR